MQKSKKEISSVFTKAAKRLLSLEQGCCPICYKDTRYGNLHLNSSAPIEGVVGTVWQARVDKEDEQRGSGYKSGRSREW